MRTIFRIGFNAFVVVESDEAGQDRLHDEIMPANECSNLCGAGVDQMQTLQIVDFSELLASMPNMSMGCQGLVKMLLSWKRENDWDFTGAKFMITVRLIKNGLTPEKLALCIGNKKIAGRDHFSRVENFLKALEPEPIQINQFVNQAFECGWLSKESVVDLFGEMYVQELKKMKRSDRE